MTIFLLTVLYPHNVLAILTKVLVDFQVKKSGIFASLRELADQFFHPKKLSPVKCLFVNFNRCICEPFFFIVKVQI